MSTVQPPPPSPPPAAAQPAASLPVLTVNNPPPALVALATGTSLAALVIGAATKGRAEIETRLGTFLAETRLPLKGQQPLLLQVAQNPGKGALVLNVLEIAGKPTLLGSQALQPGSTDQKGFPSTVAAGTSSPLLAPTSSTTLLIGSTLTATTLTAIPSVLTAQLTARSASTSGGPQSGATGRGGTSQAVTATNPVGPSSTLAGPQQGTPLSPQVPGRNSGAPGAANPTGLNVGTVFPIGSRFSLTIQTVSPATAAHGTANRQPPPSIPASPFVVGATTTGRVSAHTLSGQPIVQIHHGSVAMGTTQSIPVGTELTFKIDTLPELTDVTKPLSPALQRTGMMASGTWPSLDEGLSIIQSADPSLARQIQSVTLPKADIKLAATTLFFLSALRGGDVRGWIGDNATRLLERLRPDVMRRLGTDFRVLADLEEGGGTARATDWRGTLIPFLNGGAVEHIRLFTRQHGGEEDGADDHGTRFLVDITMSNIGRFQLDGVAEIGERRLDLIVRTSSTLPDRVRSDLMKLFTDANEVVGMRGGMVFQASPDSFVEPLEDVPQEIGVGIVV